MLKNSRRETVRILLGGLAGLVGGFSIPTIGVKQASFPGRMSWTQSPYFRCYLAHEEPDAMEEELRLRGLHPLPFTGDTCKRDL